MKESVSRARGLAIVYTIDSRLRGNDWCVVRAGRIVTENGLLFRPKREIFNRLTGVGKDLYATAFLQ
jgi:hypothetical protein